MLYCTPILSQSERPQYCLETAIYTHDRQTDSNMGLNSIRLFDKTVVDNQSTFKGAANGHLFEYILTRKKSNRNSAQSSECMRIHEGPVTKLSTTGGRTDSVHFLDDWETVVRRIGLDRKSERCWSIWAYAVVDYWKLTKSSSARRRILSSKFFITTTV